MIRFDNYAKDYKPDIGSRLNDRVTEVCCAFRDNPDLHKAQVESVLSVWQLNKDDLATWHRELIYLSGVKYSGFDNY